MLQWTFRAVEDGQTAFIFTVIWLLLLVGEGETSDENEGLFGFCKNDFS
jgi:hypothetical protein